MRIVGRDGSRKRVRAKAKRENDRRKTKHRRLLTRSGCVCHANCGGGVPPRSVDAKTGCKVSVPPPDPARLKEGRRGVALRRVPCHAGRVAAAREPPRLIAGHRG